MVSKRHNRTNRGRQVDEDYFLPVFHPRSEATRKTPDHSWATALTAPNDEDIIYDVLYYDHISKAGVNRMLKKFNNKEDIHSHANNTLQLDSKAVVPRANVVGGLLADLIVRTRIRDSIVVPITSTLQLALGQKEYQIGDGRMRNLVDDGLARALVRVFVNGRRPA